MTRVQDDYDVPSIDPEKRNRSVKRIHAIIRDRLLDYQWSGPAFGSILVKLITRKWTRRCNEATDYSENFSTSKYTDRRDIIQLTPHLLFPRPRFSLLPRARAGLALPPPHVLYRSRCNLLLPNRQFSPTAAYAFSEQLFIRSNFAQ